MAQVNSLIVKDGAGNLVEVPSLKALLEAVLDVDQVTSAYSSSVTITRPANTTPYTAGDVVGNVSSAALAFLSAGPDGGSVIINGASIEIDVGTTPSGLGGFRLYFYNATPPSAAADNAAFDLVSGDRAAFLGYIEFGTPAKLGSTHFVQADNINKQVKLTGGDDLFGYLVTLGAWTPGSGDVLRVKLSAMAV